MKKAVAPNDNERYFEWWLDDLYGIGLVIDYEFEPKTFLLSDPLPMFVEQNYVTKENVLASKTLFNQLEYTPDYLVKFDARMLHILIGYLNTDTRVLQNDPNLTKGNVYQNTLFYTTEVGAKLDEGTHEYYYEVWFDVKPPKNSHSSASMGELRYKQRMMYNRYGIIINKVVPVGSANCLYNKTFTPHRYLKCDTKDELRRKRVGKKLVPISELKSTVLSPQWLREKGLELKFA